MSREGVLLVLQNVPLRLYVNYLVSLDLKQPIERQLYEEVQLSDQRTYESILQDTHGLDSNSYSTCPDSWVFFHGTPSEYISINKC
ncbi:MAG: hypothetical protein F6K28_17040 [Microcoleus sp. SIO2G3]|nr:hypothetical protein [Microcoleus sp. SIO2G3]